MRPSVVAVVAAALAGSAHAATVELWWNISYAYVNPDQLQERRVIGVNGTWPMPFVECNQGDEVIIHAYNGLGDVGTGLHTHGMYFNNTGYYDGANAITQCPIPPGDTLTYHITTETEWGSYWIHGHYNGQYVDGLRTPFLIHPPQEVQEYDADYTLVVADWYHSEHSVLIKQFLNIYNPTGAEPTPDAAIVYLALNGQYSDSLSDMGQGQGMSAGLLSNAVLNFEPGKKYRLRFVSVSAFTMFNIALPGHNMSIIEVDGVDTQPYPVDVLPLSAAQRVSVLVEARNDTSSNWPLTLNMDYTMFDGMPDSLIPLLNVTVPVVYSSNATLQPEETFDEYPFLWDTDLVPVQAQPSYPSDTLFNFTIAFDTYDDGTNRASLLSDQNTFVSPIVPSFFTAMSMGSAASIPAVYGAQTNAFILDHLDVIDLYVYNSDVQPHPFHLHGHKFQVMWLSQNISSGDPTVNPPMPETLPNPARRDTQRIPAGGAVLLRFIADNPGAWIFHCHIEWHLESGLAVVFIEAPEQMQQRMTIPQEMLDQCTAQGIPATGNIVGFNSTTDFSGEPYGPFTQYYLMGWTAKAKGALAGCILSALFGIAIVCWYSANPFQDDEREEIAREEFQKKQKSGGKLSIVKKLIPKKK